MKIQIAGYERHSSVNGPGVRFVLFTQGCPHRCPGCQNPDTWDRNLGESMEIEELVSLILSTKYIDGVTLSGGDPLYQAEAIHILCKELKQKNINIWCYTGWTYEAIQSSPDLVAAKEALDDIDVLVDGPFVLSLLSKDCIYRGSSNQRLIDLKKSKEKGSVILMDENSLDYGL